MTAGDLPTIALSVRQPWAWAIIYGGKDIENRNWRAHCLIRRRGRIAIHSPQCMPKLEYESARKFMLLLGIECPAPLDLPRGGIIGSVEIVDVVTASKSPWFAGRYGFVLKDPRPHPFIWSLGAFGFFRWAPTTESRAKVEPAQWMLAAQREAQK
jgi:ASCH domain